MKALAANSYLLYSFGEYDLVQIMEFPDNTGAASVAIVSQAGGALTARKTTVLMSVEEKLVAFKKGAISKYKAPL